MHVTCSHKHLQQYKTGIVRHLQSKTTLIIKVAYGDLAELQEFNESYLFISAANKVRVEGFHT